ncbi:hypothetical protein QNI16_38120 [Cytophagaceae bacterium YF14B1]|uniref:Uncharacterized protein n=1 Tax=Xanthocytophaga flava TaxID=3048013 RepID=A0AAE3UAP0_9BACT|nr:hypothetical protein [Xanthocytophaga flavus]MDJ1486359.1 hypothetical protein [Xanthocytophaga flavus]
MIFTDHVFINYSRLPFLFPCTNYSMKYAELHIDHDPKVTGIKYGYSPGFFSPSFRKLNPKIDEFIFGEDIQNYKKGIIPDFDLSLHGLELDPPAKHTDFIGIMGPFRGFVISTKVKELIAKFHLPPHRFYPVTFHQKNRKTKQVQEVIGYWWLYFTMETGEKNINFAESEFYYERKYLDYKPVINTYEDYMQITDKVGKAMSAKKLVFNSNFDQQQDLWGTCYLSNTNYISPRLYEAFIENKITGYQIFMPCCKLIATV